MADTPDDKMAPKFEDGDEALLGDLFAEARDATPAPDFMARVRADALAEMPAARPASISTGTDPVVDLPGPGGWVSGLIEMLGGWPALGGLTTALFLGLGIGLAPPDSLANLTSDLLGGASAADIEDVFWTFDSTLLEG